MKSLFLWPGTYCAAVVSGIKKINIENIIINIVHSKQKYDDLIEPKKLDITGYMQNLSS